MDMSLGESLAELESVLDDAGRPFRDLTWKQIFPLPTAAALAGKLTIHPHKPKLIN